MAISLEKPTSFGTGINACYHRIEQMEMKKGSDLSTWIKLCSYADQNAAKVEDALALSVNTYTADGSLDIVAGYDYLKTLDDWKTATDC